MDLIGPFPCAKGNLPYAVVALEYFSKWVEAEPLTTITSKNVQNLLEEHNLPLQRPTTTHGGQWHTIRLRAL